MRDRVFRHGIHTVETHEEQQARRVAYLSAEYLPGPHLGLNLLNLGITEQARQALSQLALASLQVPAIGYGIRYEFGIFEQTISEEAAGINPIRDIAEFLRPERRKLRLKIFGLNQLPE